MPAITLKIAYIGGGSREWARKLMIDLALCPELTGEVALYDIDEAAACLNEKFGNWLQNQSEVLSHWRYCVVPNIKDALRGADFVIVSVQPGSLEVMAEEIDIAEQCGLYYPVGDTTGVPGLVRGLRTALIFSGFAKAIAEYCPKAWVINYTNPLAICVRTLIRTFPEIKAIGCCHEVFSTQRLLAQIAGRSLGVETPPRHAIRVNVLGINHFTWVDRANWCGHDLLALLREYINRPGVLRSYTPAEVEGWNDWFRCEHQVAFALFQRYGILAAAGDRHLVEFLPGFIRSPETLFKWGIIRTPVSWRIERWRSAPQKTDDLISGRTPLALTTSGEETVGILKALLGLGDIITNANCENRGQVSNLPLGSVVETNAHFSRDRIQPLVAGALPPGLAPLIALHSTNQDLIIRAALERNKELAFQAIFNDPSSNLPIDVAWEMYNRMLRASHATLPGWQL